MSRPRWPYLAHLPVVALLFSGPLFEGRVPYYRDLFTQHYPAYVALDRSADQGVAWPLWNPLTYTGSPFVAHYPVELAAVHLAGPLNALRLDAPLHTLLAMCGGTLLAFTLGTGAAGAW